MSKASGVADPDNSETQSVAVLAAAGAWTYTLETSREGQADVIVMAEGRNANDTVAIAGEAFVVLTENGPTTHANETLFLTDPYGGETNSPQRLPRPWPVSTVISHLPPPRAPTMKPPLAQPMKEKPSPPAIHRAATA